MAERLALVVLFLVLGCSAQHTQATESPEIPTAVYPTAPIVGELPMPPIRVWIEPGTDNLDEVRAGVDAWGMVFRGLRSFEYVDDRSTSHVAIREIGPYGGTCGGGSDQTLALGCVHQHGGLWDNRSGMPMDLYLISGNVDRAVKLTVMHEIGHLFGLGHEDGGIMWGPAPDSVLDAAWECPDAQTVARLGERLGLDGLIACDIPVEVGQ